MFVFICKGLAAIWVVHSCTEIPASMAWLALGARDTSAHGREGFSAVRLLMLLSYDLESLLFLG